MVVRALSEQFDLGVEVIGCPIIREESGLAMSSRNLRLSEEEQQQALVLSQVLYECKERWHDMQGKELKRWAIDRLQRSPGIELEYFEIADATTLNTIREKREDQSVRAFVAAQIGAIRLIDNLEIFP